MKTFKEKIEFIFWPLMKVIFISSIISASLEWLILDVLHYYSVNRLVNVFSVFIIIIPIIIMIETKVPDKDRDIPPRGKKALYFTCIFFIIPFFFLHDYMKKANQNLSVLENVSDLPNQEFSDFYTIENYYLDSINTYFEKVMLNQNLMEFYITIPMFDKASDTINPNTTIWLGRYYSKKLQNKDSIKSEFRAFISESIKDIDVSSPPLCFKRANDYYKKEAYYLENFLVSIEGSPKFNNSNNNIILTASTEEFTSRNRFNLMGLILSFSLAAGLVLVSLSFLEVD